MVECISLLFLTIGGHPGWLCPWTIDQSSHQVASSIESPLWASVNIPFYAQSFRTAPPIDFSLNPDHPFIKIPLSNFPYIIQPTYVCHLPLLGP